MRHEARLLATLALVWLSGASLLAQDGVVTKYWPLPKISFPIDVNDVQSLRPAPVSIRFYAANPEGRFELVANKKLSELERIVDDKDPNAVPRRGFSYTVERNTVKEFAVQYEFADGRLNPETKRLQPQYRVKFDLSPPTIRASVVGKNGIRWVVEDDNPLENSVRLEGRMPGRIDEWQILNTGPLKSDDNFTWSNLPADETLEVRVYAKDRAGHVGRSSILTLNGRGGAAAVDARDPVRPRAPGVEKFGDSIRAGRTDTGFGNPSDFSNTSTKIEYVNTNKLLVSSKITHITRSGVKAAQLYVLNDSNDWRPASKKDVDFTKDTPNPTVQMEYEAPRDGLYGFIIQPISGAGTKADDPRPSDTAQFLVQVDTTKPIMTIKSVRVTGAGLNGPLIDIEWESRDDNEWPEPITLEYSDDDKKTWKPIHGAKMITNNGRYTWEITDKELWRFFVRATATDKAGNSAMDETKDPTMVDLDKPSGTVDKVNPNGQPTFPKKHASSGLDNGGGAARAGNMSVTAQPSTPTVQPNVKPAAIQTPAEMVIPPSKPTPPQRTEPKPMPALPEVNPTPPPSPVPATPPMNEPPMKPLETPVIPPVVPVPVDLPKTDPLPGGLDIPPLPTKEAEKK